MCKWKPHAALLRRGRERTKREREKREKEEAAKIYSHDEG